MPDASPIELTIERLGGLGDGIGTWQGKPVMVPKTLPGDRVTAVIIHDTKERAAAEMTALLEASPQRAPAPCPHFDACGSCALQHVNEADYRAFKTRTLTEALRKAGYAEAPWQMEFLPPASRRRAEFKLLPENGAVRLAYAAPRSHRLTAISQCLILSPALHALLAPLTAALQPFRGALPTSLQLTEADTAVDVVMRSGTCFPQGEAVAEALISLPQVGRVSVEEPGGMRVLRQTAPITLQCGAYAVALPPGAFVQAARTGQDRLTQAVTEAVQGSKRLLDLFSGIGSYSFALAERAAVAAMEGDAAMVRACREAAAEFGLNQLSAQRRDLFLKPVKAAELNAYDAIILNPPRNGAKEQTAEIARSHATRVAMVSCNPATFARDAATLRQAGFRLVSALGLDQFVWSAHLEVAAGFERG